MKKGKRVVVVLKTGDYQKVKEEAKKRGSPVSTFVRMVLLESLRKEVKISD
jgi:predicted DNA binding CopG/RHH family protein